MEFKLYNSYTRKKETFVPINPKRITMYACGPTVYGPGHIGNGRSAIVFDCLNRVLRTKYDNLVYARNITDIDDKIINVSKDEKVESSVIAKRYTDQYHTDFEKLSILPPNIEPFATNHISQMIEFIENLLEKGNAYLSESHILFNVSKFSDYGKLSGRKIEDMVPGSRVEVASYKKNPSDFVLWKPSNENEVGWKSPWGKGRPGWHLECSAMIKEHLGDTIDIHGGGEDLTFPHHENEIAQSVCCNDNKPLANFWVHNGLLRSDKTKMSKSLGNFVLMKDLLDEFDGEVIRLAILSSHYRQPLIWNNDLLIQSKKTLDKLYISIAVNDLEIDKVDCRPDKEVLSALYDDLNTPKALAKIFSISKMISKSKDKGELIKSLIGSANLIGLLNYKSDDKRFKKTSNDYGEDIQKLIQERKIARDSKDYLESDRLRDILIKLGVKINDD
jgi:cysteinyl-tRNA synthetase